MLFFCNSTSFFLYKTTFIAIVYCLKLKYRGTVRMKTINQKILMVILSVIFFFVATIAIASNNNKVQQMKNENYTMQFKAFAFIFLTPGFDPKSNTVTTEKNGYRFKAVGIDMNKKEDVIAVAQSLASEGYQMIELCGGFGPEWIYKVSAALNNKVPVGGVFYGPQFRQQLADLFKKT